MDKDKLFELFEDSQIEQPSKSYEASQNNINIRMYAKIIAYHKGFEKRLIKNYKEDEEEHLIDNMKMVIQSFIHRRAWNYLEKIEINGNIEEEFRNFNYNKLLKSLKHSILHYQELEEYEKCAFILKLQKILEKSKK